MGKKGKYRPKNPNQNSNQTSRNYNNDNNFRNKNPYNFDDNYDDNQNDYTINNQKSNKYKYQQRRQNNLNETVMVNSKNLPTPEFTRQASMSQLNKNAHSSSNLDTVDDDSMFESESFLGDDEDSNIFSTEVDFSIKQWILLGLSRLIPCNHVKINLKENRISGKKQKVNKLIQDFQKEITSMKMKVIKFKYYIPCDDIELRMDRSWECRVFAASTIEKVGVILMKEYPSVEKEIEKSLRQTLQKDGINEMTRFVWVKQQFYDQAHQVLEKLHRQAKNNNSMSSDLNTSVMSTESMFIQHQKPKSQSQAQIINKRQFIPDQSGYSPPTSSSSDQDQGSTYLEMINKGANKPKKAESTKPITPSQSFKKLGHKVAQQKPIKQFEKILEGLDQNGQTYQKIQPIYPKRESRDRRVKTEYEDQELEQDSLRLQHRRGSRQNDKKTLFFQTYLMDEFDKNHLKNWVNHNRVLEYKQFQIVQKFNQEKNAMIVEIKYTSKQMSQKKEYNLKIYFQHQRIIKLNVADDLRKKIVNKFQKSSKGLNVDYTILYTNDANPSEKRLRELYHKNPKPLKGNFKRQHHVLQIKGLITLVESLDDEINQFIRDNQQITKVVPIALDLKDCNEFIREKDVIELTKQCIETYMEDKKDKYKLLDIKNTYNKLTVQIQMYNVDQKALNNTIATLKETLNSLIQTYQYDKNQYQQSKNVFDSLSDRFILKKNQKQGITLIESSLKYKQTFKHVNQEIAKNSKPIISEKAISDKSKFKLCMDFIKEKKKLEKYQSIEVKQANTDKEYKIILIGLGIIVQDLEEQISLYLDQIDEKIYRFGIVFDDQEFDILEKDKQLQDNISENYQIHMKYDKCSKIGAVLTLNPEPQFEPMSKVKTINFQKEFNFLELTQDSLFVFTDVSQINAIKQSFILQLKSKVKNANQSIFVEEPIKKCHLGYIKNGKIQSILNKMTEYKALKSTYFYLPEKNSGSYIKELISSLSSSPDYKSLTMNLTIIVTTAATSLQALIEFPESSKIKNNLTRVKRRWYAIEGDKKFYYSDKGNEKINDAILTGYNKVELTNEDLNMTVKTHKFDQSKNTITHLQSGLQFPVKVQSDKISFDLLGKTMVFPDNVYKNMPDESTSLQYFFNKPSKGSKKSCQISLGYYQIDVQKMTQKNLFSNFKRTISYEEVQQSSSQFSVMATYNKEVCKLYLQYTKESQKNIKKVEKQIQNCLSKKKIIQKVILKDGKLQAATFHAMKKYSDNQKIQVKFNQDQTQVVLSAYNKKKISSFLSLTEQYNAKNMNIKYPSEWQIQQNPIQTFVVDKKTPEFVQVQKKFTAGTITQLIRIQNKIVYQRYCQEKIWLTQHNSKKCPKLMMLYHGTSNTDPKVIYQDKEECFNINYTSQRNLLGKGIYFAERSEYSVNYSYPRSGAVERSMLYCQVIVGQSQKCPGHNNEIKDTTFKDPANGIRYESMTDFLQGSNVYVVYKNKRAYPKYLIKFSK